MDWLFLIASKSACAGVGAVAIFCLSRETSAQNAEEKEIYHVYSSCKG